MPELPEVTVIVNQLNKKLNGLVLESVEYDWPRKFFWAAGPEWPLARRGDKWVIDLKDAKVIGVRRLGKVVIIDLKRNSDQPSALSLGHSLTRSQMSLRSTEGPWPSANGVIARSRASSPRTTSISILIHLKLTGQLIYQDKKTRIAGGHPIPPLGLPVPNKTTRATFSFDNGGKLYFNDIRKFGWVKIVESSKLKVESFLEKLGPDALEISFKEFCERLKKKPNSRVKKLLMDQTFVSGIGNIYSDEALWRAKVHPARVVSSLQSLEIRNLYKGVQDSLKLAIEKGGSSANTFVDASGERGLFLTFAKAYHMTGRPCARCKTPIVRKKMDGRSAHFCPKCQKLK